MNYEYGKEGTFTPQNGIQDGRKVSPIGKSNHLKGRDLLSGSFSIVSGHAKGKIS